MQMCASLNDCRKMQQSSRLIPRKRLPQTSSQLLLIMTVIFTASAGLRTFEANSFNTWIALFRARMFTKRWLVSLPSTLLKRLYDLNHVSDILTQKISKTSDFP